MAELLKAFTLGLGNMVSPCVLPLYPAFLAYLAGSSGTLKNPNISRWLGAITLAGVLIAMLIVGLLLALLQIAVGRVLAVLLPIIYLIVIGMGVLLLLRLNPFARLPMIRSPRLQNPMLSSFLYGMLYGPMTLPCSGPLVVGIFVYGAADPRSVLDGVLYFVAFGLGFGLPLLILPLLAEPVRKSVLRWMLDHHAALERVAGVLLIIVGLIGIVSDWDLFRSYFGF